MPQRRRRRLGILAGVGAAAVVIVLVALVLWSPRSAPSSSCVPAPPQGFDNPQTITMADCGSVVPLSPHSVLTYTIARVSDTEKVEGQYTNNRSTYTAFDVYLVNMTEYGELMNNPHPTAPLASGHYFYHCGVVPECNVSVSIPGSPVTYFIALVNYGNLSLSTESTQALTMYYVPS